MAYICVPPRLPLYQTRKSLKDEEVNNTIARTAVEYARSLRTEQVPRWSCHPGALAERMSEWMNDLFFCMLLIKKHLNKRNKQVLPSTGHFSLHEKQGRNSKSSNGMIIIFLPKNIILSLDLREIEQVLTKTRSQPRSTLLSLFSQ